MIIVFSQMVATEVSTFLTRLIAVLQAVQMPIMQTLLQDFVRIVQKGV
jgi:hypothetical protein